MFPNNADISTTKINNIQIHRMVYYLPLYNLTYVELKLHMSYHIFFITWDLEDVQKKIGQAKCQCKKLVINHPALKLKWSSQKRS